MATASRWPLSLRYPAVPQFPSGETMTLSASTWRNWGRWRDSSNLLPDLCPRAAEGPHLAKVTAFWVCLFHSTHGQLYVHSGSLFQHPYPQVCNSSPTVSSEPPHHLLTRSFRSCTFWDMRGSSTLMGISRRDPALPPGTGDSLLSTLSPGPLHPLAQGLHGL